MPRKVASRNRQLGRILQLLNLFSNNPVGYTIRELQERLQATRRTLYRDIEALAAAGIFLNRASLASREVRYKLPQEYRFIKTSFDENELFSLFFAKNLLKPLDGTAFAKGMQSALDKIYKLLPSDVQDYCFFTESFFVFKQPFTKSYREYEENIKRLKEAILQNRKCEIDYRKEDRSDVHVIHPYFVTYVDGLLYVVAYSEQRAEKRTFRLDRIGRLKILPESFQRPAGFTPENFSPEEQLGRSFKIYNDENAARVEIEFAREIASYVRERTWHATQRIRDGKGGRLVLAMEIPVNQELTSWILSFGSQARVLKPAELSRQISENLQAAAGMYRCS
jgi:predicted DNA-binding transcriptional regulator YafY